MTGYCRAGDMYVDWPCPAKACTSYKKCLEQYEILKQELNHERRLCTKYEEMRKGLPLLEKR